MRQPVDVPESPLAIYAPSGECYAPSDVGLDLDHSQGNRSEADKDQNNNS